MKLVTGVKKVCANLDEEGTLWLETDATVEINGVEERVMLTVSDGIVNLTEDLEILTTALAQYVLDNLK